MTILDRLVVGVDGSDRSQRALSWAAAQVPDGHLRIVHAFPPGFKLFAAAFQINLDPQRAEHDRLLATTWSEPARTAGVEYEVELIDDDPAAAVMGVVERRGDRRWTPGTQQTERASRRPCREPTPASQ